MEKMIWEKPQMNEVAFAANEYVAACGDGGTTYKFSCNAPAGTLYYYRNLKVNDSYPADGSDDSPMKWTTQQWVDYNDDHGGRDNQAYTRLGSFTPCPAYHEASSTQDFFWGFVDRSGDGNYTHDQVETVIVWRGENGGEGHATALLNMESWETAKS